jgi:sialic acid synthase SpsE
MRIGNHDIGPRHTPYVIAEIGVNHDGDAERCVRLAEAAARAGAHAVKFQLFEADRLMGAASELAVYQRRAGETDPRSMLRRLELPIDALARAADAARALGADAIVSVFSLELVGVAEGARGGWDAYKTASPDIVHRPLLEALARTRRPLIVSTGAATLGEVTRAIGWIQRGREGGGGGAAARGGGLAVLQCVSSYPTPRESAGLGGIRALRDVYAGCVGYSDHTPEEDTGALAVVCGAQVLEKHFTDDRARAGPDHAASLDAGGFARYATLAREAWEMLKDTGSGRVPPRLAAWLDFTSRLPKEKAVLPAEEDVRRVSRQSVTALRDLAAGHVVTREDVVFKRPGTGLLACDVDEVIGRRLARAIVRDMPITREDVAR